jgi:hypothetical protein
MFAESKQKQYFVVGMDFSPSGAYMGHMAENLLIIF